MTANLLVIGSINIDLLIQTSNFPKIGETVIGENMVVSPGGKGANQAVAAARLGAKVKILGCVGNDYFADTILGNLTSAGVNCDSVKRIEATHTGAAIVEVEAKTGNNRIILIPGANHSFSPEILNDYVKEIAQADAVLLQFEIPPETVTQALKIAHNYDVEIILNAAPAISLPEDIYPQIDTLIVNEIECSILYGRLVEDKHSLSKASLNFLNKGIKKVIVTLGEKGVFFASKSFQRLIPAFRVQAIDTTGAGDAFVGAYAAKYFEHRSFINAVSYANLAGAFSTTKRTAQFSLPNRQDLEAFSKAVN